MLDPESPQERVSAPRKPKKLFTTQQTVAVRILCRVSFPTTTHRRALTQACCLQQDRFSIGALVSANPGLRSRVFQGFDKETGTQVAVKETWYLPHDTRSQQIAKLEAGMLFRIARTASSPHLMRAIESFWDESGCRYYTVLPWFSGQTLHERITQHPLRRLREEEAQTVFSQLVKAVCKLHAAGIVHRDIKCVTARWLFVSLFARAHRVWMLVDSRPTDLQTFCSTAQAPPTMVHLRWLCSQTLAWPQVWG